MKRYQANDGIPTLFTALSEYMNAEELKQLVGLTGSRAPTRKGELVEHILQHLEGGGLRTVWQSMDPLQQSAIAEVVHSYGTTFHVDRFRAKYGRDPDWGTMDAYRRGQKPTPLRFFFYADGIMPADLKKRLLTFVPPPAEAMVKTMVELPPTFDCANEHWDYKAEKMESGTAAVPLAVRESEHPAQRELVAFLRLVDAGKVLVSDKTRKPTSATVKIIGAILEDGDLYPYEPPKDNYYDENAGPVRSFAWPMLVQAGKLAQLSGKRLRLTKAGRSALSAPPAVTIRSLWSKWITTTVLDELSRIDCVKGQTGRGKRGLTALAERRDAVSSALFNCPSQDWIATEEFFRFLRASENEFAVTRNAWDLYIGELRYGSLGYEGGERVVEERYVLCLLLEYAATLGLIDVALIPPAGARPDYHDMWGTDELPYFSRYDGLMFFRINPLGAYCLDITTEYTSTPIEVKQILRVLPNMEIAAIGEDLEPGDRLALDAYAVKVSDLVWKLEHRKILSAVEQDRTVAEIREFLEARSNTPLPDTVIRLLEDAAHRCGRVHDLGRAHLIECDEASLAALIANDSRTRNHCMQAGKRHLVVPGSSVSAFKRNLCDLGYLLATGQPAKPKPPRPVKRIQAS